METHSTITELRDELTPLLDEYDNLLQQVDRPRDLTSSQHFRAEEIVLRVAIVLDDLAEHFRRRADFHQDCQR